MIFSAEPEISPQISRTRTRNFGCNARPDAYEDLAQSGVIDPAKVTRTTLQNAASIAGLLLTTGSVMVKRPGKEKAPAIPGGGAGMGDMY